MANCYFAPLSDRCLISVSGEDSHTFLQGIVTCNVDTIADNDAGFGALLTPQGKVLFDFFILRQGDRFLLDVSVVIRDELVKRLMFYRLRAKVNIEPLDDKIQIYAIWGNDNSDPGITENTIIDPRLPALGWRRYCEIAPDFMLGNYDAHRIEIGMPEGGKDFQFGSCFPHEALMDQTGGVDFTKGCYVGQEVVSRMQHRGTARKRFVPIESSDDLPTVGKTIRAGEKPIGELTSAEGKIGIALVRLDRAGKAREQGLSFLAGQVEIKINLQSWVNFSWPTETPDSGNA